MRTTRRNQKALEKELREARSAAAKARAHYWLGLFHDNNNRELKAIPHYVKAIKLGLTQVFEAKARAWLASSLYKSGKSTNALRELKISRSMTNDRNLRKFLDGLERRINS